MHSERQQLVWGIIAFIFTSLLCIALVGDRFPLLEMDSRPFDNMTSVPNWLFWPGALVAGSLAILVGDAAHTIYGLTFVWALMLLAMQPFDRLLSRFVGLFILTGAVAGLLQLNIASGMSNPQAGGLFGLYVAEGLLLPHFGFIGSNVIGATMAAIGILLATDFLFVHGIVLLNRGIVHLIRGNLALYEGVRLSVLRLRSVSAARDEEIGALYDIEEELEEVEEGPGLLQRIKEKLGPAPWERDEPEAMPEEAPPASDNGRRRRARVEAVEVEEAPAERQGPRITVAKRNTREDDYPQDDEEILLPVPEPQELPFDGVPEIAEEEEEYAAPFDEAAVQDEQGPDPREVTAALKPKPTKARQLELDTAAPPREPRIVRKKKAAKSFEEIPPDYQYPKRFTKPSVDMFELNEEKEIPNLKEKLEATSISLEECLQTFSVDARVTDVTRGPTITRFEIEPAPGVKVSRFLALADDIALALKAHRVRVEAPIPGKGRVGIEVPNYERDAVLIRELLESRPFQRGKGVLKLALGKDIAGVVKIADLATMPHLLVAGATGAGKTVCVKALLASLLCQHTPDELQLILIDPKMVELSIFNDIPHLITPVVTDPKKASVSLQWLISEMEERYRLFAELRVRNIEVYNESVDNGEIEIEGTDETDAESVDVVRKLPYIVCVIDELADLMMLARSEVEDCIARLAQLARAVGIHLIIATQRPSVDVLTGVIKANFPARMSFQVSSRVDSRCILDEIGAEKLIGNGDLLYLPAGQSKPLRIQGAFVSDDEMNALIHYLKTQAPPQYRDEIENFGKGSSKSNEILEEDDPLLDEAVQVVLETGQASISMVQRRLRVGYTRAARLIDMMELRGIVGPHTGSKAREILVNTVSARDDD